ncbi:MAG: flagellar basal body P-ring protein FlgI [Planctomycetaceae bacterium]|nr:flagellar basal body P-ring protein FlgI [Planctomycetaceae bacterium]
MSRCFRFIFVGLVVMLLAATPACAPFNFLPGGKKDSNEVDNKKDDKKKDDKKKENKPIPDSIKERLEDGKTVMVGDLTFITNVNPVPVMGFGLVMGLQNTGSDPKPSIERERVLRDMQKMGVDRPKELLARPDTAIVRIQGFTRAGILPGEHFDVEVIAPPESETTSLRHGYLMKTELAYTGFDQKMGLHSGSNVAFVEGPILVNPTANAEKSPTELLRGKILGGATATSPRSLSLVLNEESESEFIASRIAKDINHRFFVSGASKAIAEAKTGKLVFLNVHPTYSENVPRFIKVVQSIAFADTTEGRLKRLERLEKELLQPTTSATASFQLEAIGKDAVPVLRKALESRNEEVRFYAAVSLAYLNDSTAAKELGKIVKNVPEFRVFALDALGTMKSDYEAETVLRELLHENSAETRYGAFRALWHRNPGDPVIKGENMNNQFSLHCIATNSPPMVHITNSRRPEIVIFSQSVRLTGAFSLDAGPYMVHCPDGVNVVVTKFAAVGTDDKRNTSLQLDAIIRAVVELGGSYPEVVQLLYDAQSKNVLPCRLEVDKLPDAGRVYKRPQADDNEEEAEAETGKTKRNLFDFVNPKNWKPKKEVDEDRTGYNNAAIDDPRE